MAIMTELAPLAFLELKIRPPIVALVSGILMWMVVPVVPFAAFAVPYRTAIAQFLALAGLMVDVLGLLSFRHVHTTANPMTPGATTFLVTIGMYKYTRNPMYAGLLLVLFGWATYLSNAVCFALVPLAAVYLTRFQIIPEEQALSAKFGTEYADYQARVRRWF
jgi:protein-S-isoprenylcysteine O-methyltransferase Ste14